MELGIWACAEDRLRMIDALNNNALNGLEVALYHRDGSICYNQLLGGEITLAGHACLVLSLRDITVQRQQEQALRDSQERLDLALNSADLGTWDWHIPSNMLFGSARAPKLHGLKEAPFHDDFRKFFSCVPMADRHAMRKTTRIWPADDVTTIKSPTGQFTSTAKCITWRARPNSIAMRKASPNAWPAF